MLADQWDKLTGDKETAIIGYEIACHFIPPHDINFKKAISCQKCWQYALRLENPSKRKPLIF